MMKLRLTPTAVKSYVAAPPSVQKAFDKQTRLLTDNLHHLSLRAKKYDETTGIWQARVNSDWRLYFTIDGDTYVVHKLIPHPK